MSTREAGVYQSLRNHILRPEDRFERVENGLGAGMPDVSYCMAGSEGWIELKAPIEPARPSTRLLGSNANCALSIDQLNWMLKQIQARGRAFLFIATKRRLMLIPASRVVKLHLAVNEQTADQLERIATWKVRLPVVDAAQWVYLRGKLTE